VLDTQATRASDSPALVPVGPEALLQLSICASHRAQALAPDFSFTATERQPVELQGNS